MNSLRLFSVVSVYHCLVSLGPSQLHARNADRSIEKMLSGWSILLLVYRRWVGENFDSVAPLYCAPPMLYFGSMIVSATVVAVAVDAMAKVCFLNGRFAASTPAFHANELAAVPTASSQ